MPNPTPERRPRRVKPAIKNLGTKLAAIRRPAGELDVNEALRKAVLDPEFAASLMKDPQAFRVPYHLTDQEIELIQGIGNVMKGGRAAEVEYE